MYTYNRNKKIRVITVIRHPTGGVRTYLKYTYNSLDREKYEFIVLAANAEEREQLKADLKCLCTEFVAVNGFGVGFARQLLSLFWRTDSDVIHSQGYSCGLLVSFLNLLFGIPHIITFHGTFDDTTFKGRCVSLKKWIILFLLSRADVINVVSEDAKSNLLQYFPGLGKHSSKIVVIENGIDVRFYMQETEPQRDLRSIKGLDPESIVIGYAGRYMPEKGFQVLIDAVEHMANSPKAIKPFKVLALGWGSYIREYQARIREKGLIRVFVFIDFQSDMRWILKQIDMLVIPSLREAFPLIAVEGLVCGTPIIASNCIGLREVLRGTPARLVESGRPAELADAIMEMMRQPKRKEAAEFVPAAIQRFDVSVTAKQLGSIFETLTQ